MDIESYIYEKICVLDIGDEGFIIVFSSREGVVFESDKSWFFFRF